MSKLLIQTQVYENYGSAEKPHWKAKGGEDYVVPNFTDFNTVTEVVLGLRDQIESDTDYFREAIICWNVVEDSYLTEFERSQMEYEGRIVYPAKELVLA